MCEYKELVTELFGSSPQSSPLPPCPLAAFFFAFFFTFFCSLPCPFSALDMSTFTPVYSRTSSEISLPTIPHASFSLEKGQLTEGNARIELVCFRQALHEVDRDAGQPHRRAQQRAERRAAVAVLAPGVDVGEKTLTEAVRGERLRPSVCQQRSRPATELRQRLRSKRRRTAYTCR